ncbi:hypothetical protein [Novacetimonas cocois]|uniref:hypothetical protein n=1 Tax=Novacetimonas cocois TaxID=1747507 RepID=UPI001057D57C|nr:hypothetical protein [Novacetimonas cocois]
MEPPWPGNRDDAPKDTAPMAGNDQKPTETESLTADMPPAGLASKNLTAGCGECRYAQCCCTIDDTLIICLREYERQQNTTRRTHFQCAS